MRGNIPIPEIPATRCLAHGRRDLGSRSAQLIKQAILRCVGAKRYARFPLRFGLNARRLRRDQARSLGSRRVENYQYRPQFVVADIVG